MTGTDAQTAQRLKALALANEVRLAKAEQKRRIAAATDSPVEVILTTDLPFTVAELLGSVHRFGSWRVKQVTSSAAISPLAQVTRLTERQRQALAQETSRLLPSVYRR